MLQKRPHGPRVRPLCAAMLVSAATVCDSNTVWQALWTYARELISAQRAAPSSAAVMDWDSARVHSGLGPGTAVNRFILWAVNGSVAKLQELCFAHQWHFWILDCLERRAGSSELPVSSPPYFINLRVLLQSVELCMSPLVARLYIEGG